MIQGWAFNRELDLWAAAGRRLQLWWRDDDARAPSSQLDRLISLSRRYEAPATLAVVPDWDRRALATRLACERQVVVIQHGVDHRNANSKAESKGEFPSRYPREVMETRLVEARERLSVMPRFAPVFAPPWNAVHADLVGALRASGYRGLSAFGGQASFDRGFARLDVHLDLVGDCGEHRFRGADDVLARFVRLARERRHAGAWDQPIGLLTHHLEHGEAAWRFLESFLDRTTGSTAVQWRSINDLISGDRVRQPVIADRSNARASHAEDPVTVRTPSIAHKIRSI